MKKIILMVTLSVTAISCNQTKNKNMMDNNFAKNPFSKASTLPFHAPDFSRIKNKDFKPALLEGMKRQSKAINAIVNNTEKPTFKNTILALEQSKQLLDRVDNVFNALTAADTNDTLKKVQAEIAPLSAKHYDEIFLNNKLFSKVKSLYNNRENLKLDAESLKLVDYYYKKFTAAGANLADKDKVILKKINEQLAS